MKEIAEELHVGAQIQQERIGFAFEKRPRMETNQRIVGLCRYAWPGRIERASQ